MSRSDEPSSPPGAGARPPGHGTIGPDEAQTAAYDDEPPDAAVRTEQDSRPGVALSIEDLVGAKVVTAAGTSRGRVVDVLATPPPDVRVVGLVVGASGWLHRLRLAARLRPALPQASQIDEVPWKAVERWDGLRIVLRSEAEAEGVEE